jgi:hypothetical protein
MNETHQDQIISVTVKYGDLEQKFVGSVDDVWVNVNKFFSEVFPAFDISRKMILTVDLAKLIEDSRGVIAIAPEGPELLVPKDRLTDGEVLQYYLLAAYIGFKLGKIVRETMTKEELSSKFGKSAKITGTRLGELVREGRVIKVDDDGYKISTMGIRRLQEELTAIKSEVW